MLLFATTCFEIDVLK